jgi:hypothetical protein
LISNRTVRGEAAASGSVQEIDALRKAAERHVCGKMKKNREKDNRKTGDTKRQEQKNIALLIRRIIDGFSGSKLAASNLKSCGGAGAESEFGSGFVRRSNTATKTNNHNSSS